MSKQMLCRECSETVIPTLEAALIHQDELHTWTPPGENVATVLSRYRWVGKDSVPRKSALTDADQPLPFE